jgi:hypothetical protein
MQCHNFRYISNQRDNSFVNVSKKATGESPDENGLVDDVDE